jgi:long-chain acyl-CoA synthetase
VVLAGTGAAPIPSAVLRFFDGLGVPISEVYGLSENTGPMSWEVWEQSRFGTVGRAIPGDTIALGDDGEVLLKGGNVFAGYLSDPVKTAEAIDAAGWMHTGDIGVLDADGYLKIVDRKKELIITAGGKNISPANLEAAIKGIPLVGQAAVIGDGRPFISALLVLDAEAATAWATGHGLAGVSLTELAAHPDVIAEVQRELDEVNARFSNVERVKKFTLLGEEWMPDSDLLTPTMKLKRRGVNAHYAAEIEAMY